MNFASILKSPIPVFNDWPLNLPTTEAIAYQSNDQFGAELEVILNDYKTLVDSGANKKALKADKELKARFEQLVFDRLGMKIELIIGEGLAAVIPNVFVPHSGAVRDAMRNIMNYHSNELGQKALKKLDDKAILGTVNTQTAKMTGWFSEQKVPVYFDWIELFRNYKLTVPEVASICLHEFGHGFTSAEKCFTVVQSNMVINDIVKYVTDNDRGGDIEYVYRKFKKLDPNISQDVVEGLRNNNAVVFSVSAFRACIGSIENMSGSKAYNRTTNEAFADSFAVRFGYGVHLATGLDKLINSGLYKAASTFSDMSSAFVYLWIAYDLFRVITAMASGVTGLVFSMLWKIITLWVIGNTHGHSTHDYEYDTPADRIKRIENNVIGMLKDPDLDKESKRAILAQLETIQQVYANTLKLPSVIQKLVMLLSASDRNSQAGTNTQRQIEAVLANKLFVAAAKLDVKE